MPEHKEIYQQDAENYQRLIAREDYQSNLLPAMREIILPDNLDIIDLGAGTGRLACLLAPFARSLFAFDLSPHMLEIAAGKLPASQSANWLAAAADHRDIPLGPGSADLVVSGWSFCYLAVWEDENWLGALQAGLSEANRLLREGGTLMIIETLGTGVESPRPPEKLLDYFRVLDGRGFQRTWLRTDYQFSGQEEARELVSFFFGDEMLDRIGHEAQPILPECSGIWWKRAGE